MTLTYDEKKALWVQLRQRGLSSDQANYRIRNRQRYLSYFQRLRMVQPTEVIDNTNKLFVEGLKQGAKK